MRKLLLPLALLASLLAGCAPTISGSPAVPEKMITAAVQVDQKIQKETKPEAKKTIVTVEDSKIDFTKLTIECDISDQMVYVKQNNKVVCAMPTSSGLDKNPDNSTPRGEFVIEPERGEWFFAQQYKEGAKYWVSFKNHGEFLFHSVVMDENQQIIEAEAQKIGQKASHGCFRMSLSDAKWIYDHIQTGTKVIIHD